MVDFLGVPTRNELREQEYFLLLQLNGYGTNLSRRDIQDMTPMDRHWWVKKHQETLQQIREELEKD